MTNKIAIFPIRAQPPHLGHVLTVMRIYPIYEKIIVSVSPYTYGGAKRQVIHPKKAKMILEDVFRYLPKIEVILLKKPLMERTSYDDLPKFDVVITGNLEAIQKLEKLGLRTRYVERTKGLRGWSGTELREALWY